MDGECIHCHEIGNWCTCGEEEQEVDNEDNFDLQDD